MLIDLRKYDGSLVILVDFEKKEGQQKPASENGERAEPENSDKPLPVDQDISRKTPTKKAA